jgi:hypothetical protein
LAITVNENWTAAALIDAVYAGDVSCRLVRLVTDADGVSFATATEVSYINVVVACA